MKRQKKQVRQNRPVVAPNKVFDGSWLLELASRPWKNAFTAKIQKLTTRWVRCGFISQTAAESIVSDFAKHYPNFHVPRLAAKAAQIHKTQPKAEKAAGAKRGRKPKATTLKTEQATVVITEIAPKTTLVGTATVAQKRPRGRPRKTPLPTAVSATATTETPVVTPEKNPEAENK